MQHFDTDCDRRDFLKVAGLTAAAAGLGGSPLAWAQPYGGRRDHRPVLVTIYLRGGMDALNAVVPYKDARYYDIRPTIALPQPGEPDGVIELDKRWGLHPALRALKPWWDQKRFLPIINVGSHHRTRSHFSAQDYMEYAAPGAEGVTDGWLNRYLHRTKAKKGESEATLRALAMQGLLPRALRGSYPVLAVPAKDALSNDKMLDMFKKIYGDKGDQGAGGGMEGGMGGGRRDGDPVVSAGRETLEALKHYKGIVEKKAAESDAVQYPAKSKLGAKLRDLARVIHADQGLEVAAIDTGGWDDHAGEGGAEGKLADRLRDLAGALDAFARDLGPKLDTTLVVVMTEFGRTCAENGNGGTDHGHGGAWFLLGGGLKGGKVKGQWSGLEEAALYRGRDLPVTTDFRDVFHTCLAKHLDFDAPRGFFPDYQPRIVRGMF